MFGGRPKGEKPCEAEGLAGLGVRGRLGETEAGARGEYGGRTGGLSGVRNEGGELRGNGTGWGEWNGGARASSGTERWGRRGEQSSRAWGWAGWGRVG